MNLKPDAPTPQDATDDLFSRQQWKVKMMKIIQSKTGETPDATTARRNFDDWSRYDLEFRIAFIELGNRGFGSF